MYARLSVQVIESASYVSELLGTPKQSESLAGLLGQANLLNLRMGRVDVRFADAFSLREFLAAQTKRREGLSTGSTSPGTAEAASKHQVAILRALGYRVLSQINEVSVAMPAALVATVLLTLRGRGIGRNELIRRFDWLRESIVARGGRVADLGAADSGTVVDRTIKVLGDLVGEHTDVLEPTFFAAKRFSLSIARNQARLWCPARSDAARSSTSSSPSRSCARPCTRYVRRVSTRLTIAERQAGRRRGQPAHVQAGAPVRARLLVRLAQG